MPVLVTAPTASGRSWALESRRHPVRGAVATEEPIAACGGRRDQFFGEAEDYSIHGRQEWVERSADGPSTKGSESGPVSRVLFRGLVAGGRGGDHFSGPIGCPSARAPYPQLREAWSGGPRHAPKRDGPSRRRPSSPSRSGIQAHAAVSTAARSLPTWACWRWGLPCHVCRQTRGALLPHHFTLTGLETRN